MVFHGAFRRSSTLYPDLRSLAHLLRGAWNNLHDALEFSYLFTSGTAHEPIDHDHSHVHDEHHRHAHEAPLTEPYSYTHRHDSVIHAHPHA